MQKDKATSTERFKRLLADEEALFQNGPRFDFPLFDSSDREKILEFYRQQGFCVIKSVITPEKCIRVWSEFQKSLKSYTGNLRRINSDREENQFDQYGHLLNPLTTIDRNDVSEAFYEHFDAIINDETFQRVRALLLGESTDLITWNLFEANPDTVPHRDARFFPSFRESPVVGTWMPIEEISPFGGRFYVFAGSNRERDYDPLTAWEEISATTLKYREWQMSGIKKNDWPLAEFRLQVGDIVFWDPKTIHGSLPNQKEGLSRGSVTAHFRTQSFMKRARVRNGIRKILNTPRRLSRIILGKSK